MHHILLIPNEKDPEEEKVFNLVKGLNEDGSADTFVTEGFRHLNYFEMLRLVVVYISQKKIGNHFGQLWNRLIISFLRCQKMKLKNYLESQPNLQNLFEVPIT